MSAVDSDKTNATDASVVEDEEGWLCRDTTECLSPTDDREEKVEEETPNSTTMKNGVDTQNTGQDDEDGDNESDDDDDDVCVTIGDIKTGGSSRITSGNTPVNLNIKAEGRTHAVVGAKSKRVGVDAMGNIQGIPVLDMDVESFEEKPWRKPGADISDYFNYGFNEETWKAYCEKQRRLRASYESMTLSSTKIMVQKGRIGHGEKESWCDYPSSRSLYISASRKSSGTIDVIGGQTGSISGLEGCRHHSNEGNNIQVLSELSSDGDKMISFLPFNIPPPPILPSSTNVNSAPPLIPPPSFSHPPGVPTPSLIPTLDSGCSGGCGDSPILPYPFSPGVYPLIPGSMASWAGVIDSARTWEFYTRQDRGRERDKSRDRSRQRGHNKDRERGRDREREQSPPQTHNSEEAQMRHRDNTERGNNRHRDRFSRDKEEWYRGWRRRHKDEGWHKSSCSNSRMRRHDSEEGDSRLRHKHKKAKRSREDKETSHKLSANQKNQSKSNA